MTWTTRRSEKPGYYWWRLYDDEDWEVVRIVIEGDRIFHVRTGSLVEIDSSKGQWEGPIPEPEAS